MGLNEWNTVFAGMEVGIQILIGVPTVLFLY